MWHSPIWFIMSISSASVILYPSDVTNFFSSVAVMQPSPLLSKTWNASLISRIWSGVSLADFIISSSYFDARCMLLLFGSFAGALPFLEVLFSASSPAKKSSSSDNENLSLSDSPSMSSVSSKVDVRALGESWLEDALLTCGLTIGVLSFVAFGSEYENKIKLN